MTKKEGHQKFWRMKIENYFGKTQHLENFPRRPNFFRKQEEIWNRGGNASLPQGDGRPCSWKIQISVSVYAYTAALHNIYLTRFRQKNERGE